MIFLKKSIYMDRISRENIRIAQCMQSAKKELKPGRINQKISDKNNQLIFVEYTGGLCYIQCREQSCCRVALTSFFLHRMGVVLMKNKFSFNDLMQFGLFLIALLTFIYLISH